jgi:hypothetical protein
MALKPADAKAVAAMTFSACTICKMDPVNQSQQETAVHLPRSEVAKPWFNNMIVRKKWIGFYGQRPRPTITRKQNIHNNH